MRLLCMCSAVAAQATIGTDQDLGLVRTALMGRGLDARAPDFERTPGLLALRIRFAHHSRCDPILVCRFRYRQLEQAVLGLILGFHISP
jgi:hypothetical protein